MKTRQIGGKTVVVDDIVAGLIGRLIATENAISIFRQEISDLREQMAEQSPWIVPSRDGVEFKGVLVSGSDTLDSYTVKISAEGKVSITPEQVAMPAANGVA